MEPHKFEEEFKIKFHKRKIEPSPKSWEQLRAKLDKENKKPVSMYWWMSIAASFVAGILIVNLVFNSSEDPGLPMLVEEIHKTPEIESNPASIPTTGNEITLPEVSEEEETQVASLENKIHISKSNSSEEETSIAESFPKEQKQVPKIKINEDFSPKSEDIIAATITQNIEELTSEDEVDALLQDAADQLYRETKYRESVSDIYANTLLQSVENELNQSFREKIFELLKDGYLKTKNAVAARNN